MSDLGLSPQDIRDAQVAQLDSVMGTYEFNAVLGGYPPGHSVMNPHALKVAIENNEISPEQTPIGKLQAELEAICGGPQPKPEYTLKFAEKANPLPEASADANNDLTTDMKFR